MGLEHTTPNPMLDVHLSALGCLRLYRLCIPCPRFRGTSGQSLKRRGKGRKGTKPLTIIALTSVSPASEKVPAVWASIGEAFDIASSIRVKEESIVEMRRLPIENESRRIGKREKEGVGGEEDGKNKVGMDDWKECGAVGLRQQDLCESGRCHGCAFLSAECHKTRHDVTLSW